MKVIKVLVKNNSLIVEELYQKNFEDSDNIMYFTLKYIKYNKDKVKELLNSNNADTIIYKDFDSFITLYDIVNIKNIKFDIQMSLTRRELDKLLNMNINSIECFFIPSDYVHELTMKGVKIKLVNNLNFSLEFIVNNNFKNLKNIYYRKKVSFYSVKEVKENLVSFLSVSNSLCIIDLYFYDDKIIEEIVNNLIKAGVENAAFAHMEQVGHGKYNINDEEITKEFNNQFFGQGAVDIGVIQTLDENQICDYLTDIAFKKLEEKKAMFEDEIYQEFLKVVVLRVFDTHWTEHIDKMSELRQGVSLQSYAQQNPFQIYQKEGVELFNKMMRNIETDVLKYLMRAQIRSNLEREEVNKNTVTNDSKGGEIKRAPQKNLVTVGRNDLCPCGSGKKYKYCHGR